MAVEKFTTITDEQGRLKAIELDGQFRLELSDYHIAQAKDDSAFVTLYFYAQRVDSRVDAPQE